MFVCKQQAKNSKIILKILADIGCVQKPHFVICLSDNPFRNISCSLVNISKHRLVRLRSHDIYQLHRPRVRER